MTKWITILISVCGLAVAVYVVATSGEKSPDLPPAAAPTVNPFDDGIAASGTVEASTRNLSINAPVGALVMDVLTEVNDAVAKDQTLFTLDSRELRAQLLRQQAAIVSAEAQLTRLKGQPRPEDLPPLRAAVDRAKSRLADVEDWYVTIRGALEDQAAATKEVRRAQFAVYTAQAELAEAQAQLDLALAGAWKLDISIAQAAVDAAKADAEATRSLIDRMTVRAPVAGVVLKRHVEPGRFATTDPKDPAMVIGDLNRLNIRAQVDEEDLPRLVDGARGIARVRGASEKKLPLTMIRIEPLATPKMSLTGAVTERVDTRVVEVLFRVDSAEGMRLFPGQVVDVYIDSAKR